MILSTIGADPSYLYLLFTTTNGNPPPGGAQELESSKMEPTNPSRFSVLRHRNASERSAIPIIRDLRGTDHFSIANVIVDVYLPKIGMEAFTFYCALVRASEFGGMVTLTKICEASGIPPGHLSDILVVLEEQRLIDFREDLVINHIPLR